jgi:hypothetical protein
VEAKINTAAAKEMQTALIAKLGSTWFVVITDFLELFGIKFSGFQRRCHRARLDAKFRRRYC